MNNPGYGGADNDVLEGGSYADLLDGGPGDDTVSYARSPAGVDVNLFWGWGSLADAAGDRILRVEKVVGSQYGDRLTGSSGADTLEGGAGADWLAGGAGADTLWGGTGADRFAFVAAADSTSGTRDLIKDFKSSDGDRIDLSDLTGFGEASTFIAGRAFSNLAGEVRYAQRTESGTAYTDVFGDADGNGAADFVVTLAGAHNLTESDFFLG